MTKSTKQYSMNQENMIAKYLGWTRVYGSGARPTKVGDVQSSDWLGECKTHVLSQQPVVFKHNVWQKICEEAMSIRKYPVLFVDDGSQTSDKTWCMTAGCNPWATDFPTISINGGESFLSGSSLKVSDSMMSQTSNIYVIRSTDPRVADIYICTLEVFRDVFLGDV